MLDRLLLSELVAAGADVLLKVVQRLLPQVAAVHEEQNTFGLGELDQPVAEVDGSERLHCLAASCSLLHCQSLHAVAYLMPRAALRAVE